MSGDNAASNTGERKDMKKIALAEILLPSKGIAEDVEFWTSEQPGLGFRMEQIYPADNPQVVTLSGHGIRMRLDTRLKTSSSMTGDGDGGDDDDSPSPGIIRLLLCDDAQSAFDGKHEFTSPSGTRVQIVDAPKATTGSGTTTTQSLPTTQHAFLTRRLKDNAPWIIGRAGMHYRDLIPGRLGGAIIASHIRIPDAGPVPDKVHFHDVGFQLIYCLHGWVRLVYEDQGPPFILSSGDCVIQPPRIRHRVLEASANLQVLEIGVPAEHMTTIDHEMSLPTTEAEAEAFNAIRRPDREWDGQRFVHSLAAEAVWERPWRLPGFEARDTGVGHGTKGVAAVHIARPIKEGSPPESSVLVTSHTSDILFAFVLTGSCTLHGEGQGSHTLTEGDAYVLPPHLKTKLTDCSDDLTLLEVSLPADFRTEVHPDEELK
ncbi:hypothetical protein N0V82_010631 [Gnomoniopsis sp. IMI 355080]|nr:hypothetical protein N0V82_010631 [Gnomoniopsis sp. IMI 355080]